MGTALGNAGGMEDGAASRSALRQTSRCLSGRITRSRPDGSPRGESENHALALYFRAPERKGRMSESPLIK